MEQKMEKEITGEMVEKIERINNAQGERVETVVSLFNDEGLLLAEKKYDLTGRLVRERQFTYTTEGEQLKIEDFDDKGNLFRTCHITVKAEKRVEWWHEEGKSDWRYEYTRAGVLVLAQEYIHNRRVGERRWDL